MAGLGFKVSVSQSLELPISLRGARDLGNSFLHGCEAS